MEGKMVKAEMFGRTREVAGLWEPLGQLVACAWRCAFAGYAVAWHEQKEAFKATFEIINVLFLMAEAILKDVIFFRNEVG
jgi:hypothetical protein